MNIIKQYKESLKAVEAEEILDLIIFRPIAFIFVKATYSTRLTPNQTSGFAMLIGVTGGLIYGFGTYTALVAGSAMYFMCNVLDCADGQIARLKKNGTKVGRVVDGFIDYVVSIAVFAGIGAGMTASFKDSSLHLYGNQFININPVAYIWAATVLAGVSSAAQALVFDYYRNKFLEISFGKFSSLEDEIKEFEEEKQRLAREKPPGMAIDNFLISVYLGYSRLQYKFQSKNHGKNITAPDPKLYFRKNKLLLRMWSFMGSTTHISLCIYCALSGNFELFLLLCILPLNILMAVLYFIQSRVNGELFGQVNQTG